MRCITDDINVSRIMQVMRLLELRLKLKKILKVKICNSLKADYIQ